MAYAAQILLPDVMKKIVRIFHPCIDEFKEDSGRDFVESDGIMGREKDSKDVEEDDGDKALCCYN